VDVALVSWKPEGSTYYHGLGDDLNWEQRDAGLSGAELIDIFGAVDPWWWTFGKQGTYNPDSVILFKSYLGSLLRTENGGRLSWEDITPTGTPSDAQIMAIESDVFTDKVHYFMMRYQNASGTWSSHIVKTDDDGTSYEWGDVT
jgi:hypothetical protein